MTTNNTTANPLADGSRDEVDKKQISTADKENQNRTTSGGNKKDNKTNNKITIDNTSNSTITSRTSSTAAVTNTPTSISNAHVTATTAANRSSRSDFTSPRNGVNPKKDGWAMELEDSEKHYRRTSVDDEGSNEVLFRLLQAQFKMRKFDDLMKVVTSDEKGQKIIETSFTSQQSQVLKIYKAKAEQILNIPTDLTKPSFQRLVKDARRGKLNINFVVRTLDGLHDFFMNTNIFHYACLQGDVRLMEAVVAHGAAIDQPFLDRDPERPEEPRPWHPSKMAPTNVTAITFLCAVMALNRCQDVMVSSPTKEGIECVVQLINLGADCSSQLCLPFPDRKWEWDAEPWLLKMFRKAGFEGKTAYELGMMTKNKRIIDAMNRMKSRDDKIKHAHCRCGSRLPWKECHAGSREEIHAHYHIGGANSTSDSERVMFRVSPTSNCPCNNNTGTTKMYFKCCWKETVNPTYLDDTTFEHINPKLCLNDMSAQMSVIENYSYRSKTWVSIRFKGICLPSNTLAQYFRRDPDTAKNLRQERIVRRSGRRSVVYDSWDMEIYSEIMERVPNCFDWIDLHWDIPYTELLTRVDEWNSALAKYCDDMGLLGDDEERQSIVDIHTASPLAPCANPLCTNMETFVKEFRACSGCRRVRYCSRECQASNWKVHKKACRMLLNS